jgi:ADP-sugar diphosphatase
MSYINVNGIKVYSNDVEIQSQLSIIVESPKFKKFISSLDINILEIIGIAIYGVKWFCNPKAPVSEKLGFLYLEIFASDKRNGKPVPGVVFLRGDAVAVYLRVNYKGNKFVVLTKQVRGPVGNFVLEIPAGMMDDSDNFVGIAMKEITEETGIIAPSKESLIPLTKIWPSPGGCDEGIELFYLELDIDEEKFNKMQSETYGAEHENESIQLVLVPEEKYEQILMIIGDVKAISAHFAAKQKGLVSVHVLQEENVESKMIIKKLFLILIGCFIVNIGLNIYISIVV